MLDNSHITLLKREYVPTTDGFARVSIGQITVTVIDNPFWQKFADGWEADTERVYQSCMTPGSTVLDIGAWIGPTLLFSLACGAEHIYAIEPNPHSYELLKSLLELNPPVADQITLINKAVGAQSGIVKMGLVQGEDDTSLFSIRTQSSQTHGNQTQSSQPRDFQIPATTINEVILDHALDKIDLIKIDIEGAEVMLCEDLNFLSRCQQLCIHLSIHVPFFPQTADIPAFANSLKNFTVYDDRGEILRQEKLAKRLMTLTSHPEWGTKHGNFFELVLLTRPAFIARRADC